MLHSTMRNPHEDPSARKSCVHDSSIQAGTPISSLAFNGTAREATLGAVETPVAKRLLACHWPCACVGHPKTSTARGLEHWQRGGKARPMLGLVLHPHHPLCSNFAS